MLAFNSKHPYVPNPSKDPSSSRWIASLSDGTTVFQDFTPGVRSAWRRLAEHIEENNLEITNLRLEAYGTVVKLVPYKTEDGTAQLNGYWHSRGSGTLLHAGGKLQADFSGIGFVKAKKIYITWVYHDGSIRQELRDYNKSDLACIVNNPPA